MVGSGEYVSEPSGSIKMHGGADQPFASILPSSGLLCGMRWFKTDVSGPPIGSVFKGQGLKVLRQLDL